MSIIIEVPLAKRHSINREAQKRRMIKSAKINAVGTSFSGNGTMTEKELEEGFKKTLSKYDIHSW